jgi:hypothetical protein
MGWDVWMDWGWDVINGNGCMDGNQWDWNHIGWMVQVKRNKSHHSIIIHHS